MTREQFWIEASAALGIKGDVPEHFAFGDSLKMADDLLALVMDGSKTATAGLVADYENDGDPLPQAGQYFIVLGGDGEPRALVQTTELRVGAFGSCSAQFAYDEGEGDKTLAWWRQAHWRFFSKRCDQLGIVMHEDIEVAFERLKCLYPAPPA